MCAYVYAQGLKGRRVSKHLSFYVSTCVLACMSLHCERAHSESRYYPKFEDTISSSPKLGFYCHIPQTHPASLSLLLSLPSFWQSLPLPAGAHSGGSQSANLPSICPPPQCQLTLATPHQDSAGQPSPNLFPLPNTHPPLQHPPLDILQTHTHTHTPNLLLSRTKTWSTFGSLLTFTCLIFPCASSFPFSPFLTLHSALLWPSSALLPPPEQPLVVALFFETSLDIMLRDRSRHSQNKKPGHINQRRSIWRPRVRSMHHPSTGCTLGFIGETSVVGQVLLLASYSGLYWAQGTDAWCECLKRSMFICLHSLRTAHITLSDRSACSVFPQDAKQPPYPLTPSNQINTSQRINTQTECPKNWMWEDELYPPAPFMLSSKRKKKRHHFSNTYCSATWTNNSAVCEIYTQL